MSYLRGLAGNIKSLERLPNQKEKMQNVQNKQENS